MLKREEEEEEGAVPRSLPGCHWAQHHLWGSCQEGVAECFRCLLPAEEPEGGPSTARLSDPIEILS